MTGDYFIDLISRYRGRGVLLDSNLLLLYFVGRYDPERIGSFKRTLSHGFTVDDFELLCRLLDLFNTVVTTPNILTEVSNLSNQLRNEERDTYSFVFAHCTDLLTEYYTESKRLCVIEYFKHYGLTDSGIVTTAKDKYLVVTVDSPLVGWLQDLGIDVINFNHLKSLSFEA